MNFSELNLNENLIKAVTELNYQVATQIQEKTIPVLLESERDFIGQAQTGTGKTAAFMLPLLQRIANKNDAEGVAKNVQAVILAPTRELALQIHEETNKLGKYLKISSCVIYGGASYEKQISTLKHKHPQIVIGTPGRVIDLINKKALKITHSEYLILDEADEMLKMGFFEDVQTILQSFPSEKKIWMFSATMPLFILNLVKKEFREPVIVKANENKTNTPNAISQFYFLVQKRNFKEALYRILIAEKDLYAVVFCQMRTEVKDITTMLIEKGLKADMLTGEMGQAQREMTLTRFKSKKCNILVCTDVAARGIDINDLTHVINYGLPQDIDSYTHRIGRTGRAQKSGTAYTIVDQRDLGYLRKIVYVTNNKISQKLVPTISVLKNYLINTYLEKLNPIVESLNEKGDQFKLDPTFETFKDYFKGLKKEEIEKVFFTLQFNREFMRLNTIDDTLDIVLKERSRQYERGRNERGGRNERSGQNEHSRNRDRYPNKKRSHERHERSERSERSDSRDYKKHKNYKDHKNKSSI